MLEKWHRAISHLWHDFVKSTRNYLSEDELPSLSFLSSLFSSFISLLKIRSERPKERAESGNFFEPNKTRPTINKTTMCQGANEFMALAYPKESKTSVTTDLLIQP